MDADDTAKWKALLKAADNVWLDLSTVRSAVQQGYGTTDIPNACVLCGSACPNPRVGLWMFWPSSTEPMGPRYCIPAAFARAQLAQGSIDVSRQFLGRNCASKMRKHLSPEQWKTFADHDLGDLD